MPLILTVTSYQGLPFSRQIQKKFEYTAGVIGRGIGCDWILEDPDEIISKRHCRIVPEGDIFRLIDTSTNGVFVNGARQRVPFNSEVILHDGDELLIGEYGIKVRIDEPLRPHGGGQKGLATPDSDYYGQDAAPAPLAPLFPGGAGSDCAYDIEQAVYQGAPVAPSVGIPVDEDWLAGPAPDHAPIEQHLIHVSDAVPPSADRPASLFPPGYNPMTDDEGDDFPPPGETIGSVSSPIAPRPAAVPPAPMPHSARPGDAVEAFLKGAGLSREQAGGAPDDALMQVAGQRFRELVDGLRNLLRVRAQIKSELRVDHTVLAKGGNNPLKFSVDGDAALLALLQPTRPGFMPSDKAIAESFTDLHQHELALLAGARQAVATALAHFEPKALVGRLDKGGTLSNLLPATRKARYWGLFESEFQRVAEEAEEDAHGPLARALARAYEDQKKHS